MPETHPRVVAANQLVERLTPFQLALALVDAATPAGSYLQWDVETVEYVTAPLADAMHAAGLPDILDQDLDGANYWRRIAGLDLYTADDFE